MARKKEPARQNVVMRIASAHVAATAYPHSFKWDKVQCLVHAVELAADGITPVRVLCGKVKPESILPDGTMYDKNAVTCRGCAAICVAMTSKDLLALASATLTNSKVSAGKEFYCAYCNTRHPNHKPICAVIIAMRLSVGLAAKVAKRSDNRQGKYENG